MRCGCDGRVWCVRCGPTERCVVGAGWVAGVGWRLGGGCVHADDTVILGVTGQHVEEYMASIEAHGKEYGLQIHWGKVQLVTVCGDQALHTPDGT